MSKPAFWLVYVPMLLVGSALFNALDAPEPPPAHLADLVAHAVGAGLVFGALGAAIGFGIAWYRVRPEPMASISGRALRRDVLLATLGVLALILLYTLGTRAPLG